MRRMALLAVAAAVGFAPAPFPKAQRKRADQTDVVGRWKFSAWEYNGQRQPNLETTYAAKLTRERFELTPSGGTYEMRLDANVSPPAFTWSMGGRMTHVGSYRLVGDRIQMVFVSGTQIENRPLDVSAPPPNGWRFVMERVGRD